MLVTNLDKTGSTFSMVEEAAIKAVNEHNKDYLNVFDTYLSDVELSSKVKDSNKAITSVYTRKTLSKACSIVRNNTSYTDVFFGNHLIEGSLVASMNYGVYKWNIYDKDGKVYAKAITDKDIIVQIGTIDYVKGILTVRYPTTIYTGKEIVRFTCTPKNPDIASSHNNIVRISKVRVVDE